MKLQLAAVAVGQLQLVAVAVGPVAVDRTCSWPVAVGRSCMHDICQKVAMLPSYPRSEESIRSCKLYRFIAHCDSLNRTNVL